MSFLMPFFACELYFLFLVDYPWPLRVSTIIGTLILGHGAFLYPARREKHNADQIARSKDRIGRTIKLGNCQTILEAAILSGDCDAAEVILQEGPVQIPHCDIDNGNRYYDRIVGQVACAGLYSMFMLLCVHGGTLRDEHWSKTREFVTKACDTIAHAIFRKECMTPIRPKSRCITCSPELFIGILKINAALDAVDKSCGSFSAPMTGDVIKAMRTAADCFSIVETDNGMRINHKANGECST